MKHLTLEQCRKLKELGAPQDTPQFAWFCPGFCGEEDPYVDINFEADHNLAAAYTLEELIDWLGDDFNQLRLDDISKEYSAYNRTHHEHKYRSGEGDTALEAVYNLAVALKQ